MIKNHFFLLFVFLIVTSCSNENTIETIEILKPTTITQKVKHDTDDPAIWINKENPEMSIIFGTDKESDGAIYAFDLNGNIISGKVIRNIQRPNNIDVEYGMQFQNKSIDIIAFTERERGMLRIYSIPDMRAIDGGGFPVFVDEPEGEFRMPMGIALYKSGRDVYAMVGRKNGPVDGSYIWQYLLGTDSTGTLTATVVRKFGVFSGQKEIEAIAVDDELGYVYLSDEGVGIRKYFAEPDSSADELTIFGQDGFQDDIEGIAIYAKSDHSGYLLVSDQQAQAIRIFDRQSNNFIRSVKYEALETDGIEITHINLGSSYPKGLLVAMSDDKTFHYYDPRKLGF